MNRRAVGHGNKKDVPRHRQPACDSLPPWQRRRERRHDQVEERLHTEFPEGNKSRALLHLRPNQRHKSEEWMDDRGQLQQRGRRRQARRIESEQGRHDNIEERFDDELSQGSKSRTPPRMRLNQRHKSEECMNDRGHLQQRGRRRQARRIGREAEQSRTQCETMFIPKPAVGRVIGKKGEHILSIQHRSGAKLDIHGTTLEIRGSTQSIMCAKDMINQVIDLSAVQPTATSAESASETLEEIIDVPPKRLGSLIGKGGETIRAIEKQSSARLLIDQQVDPPTVCIKGSSDAVVLALELIGEKIYGDGSAKVINIPPEHVGRVIGKGGETVKRVERESGAKIDVDDKANPPTVRIYGSGDHVALAEELISRLIDHGSTLDAEELTEESMSLPAVSFGKIVGRGGSYINEVRESSGARIHVKKEDNRCEVCFSGTHEQVNLAKGMIAAALESMLLEGEEARAGPSDEVTMTLPISSFGKIVGRGGSRIDEIREASGAQICIDREEGQCKVRLSGTLAQIFRAKEEVARAAESEHVNNEQARVGSYVGTIYLPAGSRGKILGHGGSRIQEIRQLSGAQIHLSDDGPNCRVALVGSPKQIQLAHEMIKGMRELASCELDHAVPDDNGFDGDQEQKGQEEEEKEEEEEKQQQQGILQPQPRPSAYLGPPKPSRAPHLLFAESESE